MWPAYLDESVESVYGREFKVQAEKVEGEDADYISLQGENTSRVSIKIIYVSKTVVQPLTLNRWDFR